MNEKMTKILSLIEKARNLILELEKELAKEAVKIKEIEDEKFAMPISVLGLSRRAENCISNFDITTVGELIGYTKSDLLKARNMGNSTIKEISEKLVAIGLKLGDSTVVRQRKIDEILSHING